MPSNHVVLYMYDTHVITSVSYPAKARLSCIIKQSSVYDTINRQSRCHCTFEWDVCTNNRVIKGKNSSKHKTLKSKRVEFIFFYMYAEMCSHRGQYLQNVDYVKPLLGQFM